MRKMSLHILFNVFKDMQLFHKAISATYIDLCLYFCFSLTSGYILCFITNLILRIHIHKFKSPFLFDHFL